MNHQEMTTTRNSSKLRTTILNVVKVNKNCIILPIMNIFAVGSLRDFAIRSPCTESSYIFEIVPYSTSTDIVGKDYRVECSTIG